MSAPAYPQPSETRANAPLLDAWRRGELVMQRCGQCSADVFFPREVCPVCWSSDLQWSRKSGRGRIVSFSRVFSHVTEPFVGESPITLAEIELEDGGAMLARVLVKAGETIREGLRVELVPMTEAARFTLPTFRLA